MKFIHRVIDKVKFELYNLFNITTNAKDFISNNKLQELIDEKDIPFTAQKCKKLLIALGAVAGRNKIIFRRAREIAREIEIGT